LKRLEQLRSRRIALSAVIATLLVAMIVGNFPGGGILGQLSTATQPLRNATGLQQNWTVFSPPRTISAYVDGRVDFSDGSTASFPITTRPGFGAYVDYRWQKYEEVIRPDDGRELWPQYAELVADRARSSGHRPRRVTLVRRWADTLPPGPGPQRDTWHEATMYVLELPG
jgi:hypothetical protein